MPVTSFNTMKRLTETFCIYVIFLRKKLVIFLPLLFLLTLSGSTYAHNGAVAIAAPVGNITVDGDFSDWPETITRQPLRFLLWGDKFHGNADFLGSFRIGYNSDDNALYLAIEAVDESRIIDNKPDRAWDSEDNCEVYISQSHGKQSNVRQLVARAVMNTDGPGNKISGKSIYAYTFSGPTHRYEWRIQLEGVDITGHEEGTTIGLDIALCDKDADGSFSWVSWGRFGAKFQSNDYLGDVIVPGNKTVPGRLEGRVLGKNGKPRSLTTVIVRSAADSTLWTTLYSDSSGAFGAELPAGGYSAVVKMGRGTAKSEPVTVQPENPAVITLICPQSFGTTIPAGSGKARKAGKGFRDGNMLSLTAADGIRGYLRAWLQSSSGYIWFGSSEGLFRYDGENIVHYTTNDGMPANHVYALAEDTEGCLWIGTQFGLAKYTSAEFIHYTIDDGLISDWIRSLATDDEGKIWGGTAGGFFSIRDGSIENYSTDGGVDINILEKGVENDLWIGSFSGLYHLKNGAVSRIEGLPTDAVTAIERQQDGSVWAGSWKGLYLLNGRRIQDFSAGVEHKKIDAILKDSKGTLWITCGGKTYQMEIKETGHIKVREIENVHGSGIIQEDFEGNIWISGVRYDTGRYKAYTQNNGLASNNIKALLWDKEGRIWAGTDKGLSCIDDDKVRTYTIKDGLAGDQVSSLAEDSHGHVWIGTVNGISCFDGKSFTSYRTKQGLAHDVVTKIVTDRQGQVWIGTFQGLSCFNGTAFKTYTTGDGLVYNTIVSLESDQENRVWAGTEIGLSSFDGKTFKNYSHEETLSGRYFRSIHSSTDSAVWFGTRNGLIRYFQNSFTLYTEPDGLASGEISNISEMGNGTLLLATQGGLERFDGAVFQSMWGEDGLPRQTISDVIEDSGGNVWIATMGGGIVRYTPNVSHPFIVMTDVVSNVHHGAVSELTATTQNGLISFEYHGISYKTRPEAMRYRYRLAGHEAEWMITAESKVEYPGLPRGEYGFEVQAIDRDLNYSEQPARVHVTVTLPWATIVLWLLLGMSGAAITALIIVIITRNRRLDRSLTELKHSETKVDALFENAPAGIVIVNKSGIIEKINSQIVRYFGYDRNELNGQKIEILVPEGIREKHVGLRNKYLNDSRLRKNDVNLELTGRKKNGMEFPVSVSLSSVGQDEGLLVIASVQDITERKKAENALIASEEKLARINKLSDNALELTKAGFWHIDYSDPDYYYASDKAMKIFGEYPKDDMRYHLMEEWYSRIEAADKTIAEATGEKYQGALDGKYKRYDAVYPYKRPVDGNVVWIRAIGDIVRNNKGEATYMYGVTQDITDYVKAEEELKERMEDLERFSRLTINREEKMIQLKEEINTLLNQRGKEEKYKIVE